MQRLTALVLMLFLVGAGSARAEATLGGPLGVPLPLFPTAPTPNWWNQDVSSAPLDPRSAAFISFIGGSSRQVHPDFGGEVSPGSDGIYGFPYVVVDGAEPKVPVSFTYSGESDAGPYPIPEAAKAEPHWIEGGTPGGGASGDRHMLIVDRAENRLYELYALRWTGSQWAAGSGAIFDMDTNDRRPEGWTSADAAGLAILPGLVRYDEVYESSQPIRHAFRVTVQRTNGHVYPASHTAGGSAGALPMGARLRLKAGKDISAYPAPIRKIFQAMKTYGLIVADNGSNMYVSGSFDTRWDNGVLNPAFHSLRASDFEVVRLGWRPPDSNLAVSDAVVAEGSGLTVNASFTVTLSPPSSVPVTVSYATVAGIAAAGVDFTSRAGTLSFAAGATSRTVTVPVRGDLLDEADETFRLRLSNPREANLADAEGVATIQDDDDPPVVSIGAASLAEGDAGAAHMLFGVSLSAPSGRTVSVAYATADILAAGGQDYAAASGILSFPPGTVRRSVAVPVSGDVDDEPDETFSVTLSAPANARLGEAAAVGTILDDDTLPALAVGDAVVTEGTGGTTEAVVTVRLSRPAGQTVTVRFTTAGGTAAAGADFRYSAGTLSFPPGAASLPIAVRVVPDSLVERNEALLVRLSTPAGAKLVRGQGQVAIRDDDGAADPCLPVLALPFTVSAPGQYCLAAPVTTAQRSGAAITVAADGVGVDLKGFSLTNSAGIGSQAYGIYAAGRRDVAVRNGLLQGFFTGVFLGESGAFTDPQGLVVERVKASYSRRAGIWVEGRGSRIADSTVFGTGGTTALGLAADVAGIVVRGPEPQLARNLVQNTAPVGSGTAVSLALVAADGAAVTASRFANAVLRNSVGVLLDASAGATVSGNSFDLLGYGIVFSGGSTGTQFDNTMTRVAVPVVGP